MKRQISFAFGFIAATAAAFALPTFSSSQQVINVAGGDVPGLISAINTLNSGGGGFILLAPGSTYVVNAPADWTYGPNAFPAIQSSIFIDGNGSTISRAPGSPNFRFFYVSGGFSTLPAGLLTLRNLTLEGGLAQGGQGGNAIAPGGGGAGFGGVLLNQGQVNLIDVQLNQNGAQGGAGGTSTNCSSSGSAGGGGGLGGNGGNACNASWVGGGGGFQYSGGSGQLNGPGGGFVGSEGGAASNGGQSSVGGNGGPGSSNYISGGGGGGFSPGENGGTPTGATGGGNGGFTIFRSGSVGGGGGAFGGGGGAYLTDGGGGGVGGGGGGASTYSGGTGGFGGGGGGGLGPGGFGGGWGAQSTITASTGGSGYGGVLFNHIGSMVLVRTAASSNSAAGGASGSGGDIVASRVGTGEGGVIFDLNGNLTIEDSSIAGSNGNSANTANSVYVETSNAGNTASGQTPAGVVVQTSAGLGSADLVSNQVDGTITLSTSVSLPEVTVQPETSLSFASPLNNASAPVSITLTNIGTETLSVNSISATAPFSIQNNTCVSIIPQNMCTFDVVFTPTSTGTFYGAVVISDSAPEVVQVIYVGGTEGQPQTITFGTLPPQPAPLNVPFTLDAISSAGLPVTLKSNIPQVCTVSGNTVTPVAAGTCSITATQSGNSTYTPAEASVSIITGTSQTIVFGPIGQQLITAGSIILTASSSSGLPVSFVSMTPPVCTVSGSTASFVAVGTCTIVANQAGNDTYASAPPVSQTFQIVTITQTVTFGAIASQLISTGSISLSATASSGLAVSFTSLTTAVCSVTSTTATFLNVGSCTIQATQAGNGTYAPATPVSQTFQIVLVTQTIAFGPIPSQLIGTGSILLSATSSSGLPVSFTSLTTAACSVSGTTATFLTVGSCTIQATQAGNGTYSAATPVSQTFQIVLAMQTITFGVIGDQLISTGSILLSATSSSGLPVSFTSLTTAVCSVSSSTAQFLNSGTCTIEATQAGSATYAPANSVNQSFQISVLPLQTITFNPIPDRVLGAPALPVSASASSGLPVTLTSNTTGVCALAGFALSVVSTGTCSLTASQPGNAFYEPAPQVTQSFTVSATPPEILVADGDVAGLINAIQTINLAGVGYIQLASGGSYTISAPSDWWYGPNAFQAIQSNMRIEGNGATISRQLGAPNFRFFYVSGGFSSIPSGALTLNNLTLQNGLAQGGRGGNGISSGGGAAGMGGAIFNQGQLTLIDVQLLQNTAIAGNGGVYNCAGSGGGGGLGGDGGDACGDNYSTAGGGGFRYGGGAGELKGGGGSFAGNEGGSDGLGGTSVYGGNGGGGNLNLVAGGGGGYSTGQNGGTPYGAIGGGTGGAVGGYSGLFGGGGGAFGGGGAANAGPGGGGGVGGGGAGSQGWPGGQGGFGGGAGGGSLGNTAGGFGGGRGANYLLAASGGGTGFGGSVFNHTGTLVLVRTTATNNGAAGGAGGQAMSYTGPAGPGYGGVIFDLNGSVTIQDSSIAGANGNTADSGNSVYVMSSNAGITASGQTPDAVLTQSNSSLNGTDLVVDQSNGTATSQTASLPEVSLQPAVLSCPGAIIGQSTTCSLMISNIGSAQLTASFSAGSGSSFSVVNASACASIAAQSSCTLTIQFTPAAGGLASGAIEITSNAPDSPEVVLVSGTAVTPPSSFTLSSTLNPAQYGASVTLTATVSPSSATGAVTFYDGVTIVGDAPLSNGVATLKTVLLSSGTRSLTARYEGGVSSPYAPAVSAVDVQTVNALPANNLVPTSPISIGTTFAANLTLVNDFNGDGYQDLAMLYTAENAVVILLGNGSGGFTPAGGGTYTVGANPYSMVAADFNNDGIPDLAISSNVDNNVTVLLGKGDGTFAPAGGSPFGAGSGSWGLAVGDFNGDGNADLAIADVYGGVTVLLGTGTGGFTAAGGSPITVGFQPALLAVADFNGDGIADIAVTGNQEQVVVLLGDGQGGFTSTGNPAAIGSSPYGLVTADFNGDGEADLAVANYGSNNLTVLLGNGAGGFIAAPGSPIPVPQYPYSLAVGDFNGDGHPDLAVATQDNTATILLGNGSGGFTSAPYSPLAPTSGAYSVAAGQFTGDGHTDLAVAAFDYVTIYQGEAVPQLQITQQPGSGTVGAAFGNVVVDINDASGNLMTGATSPVTIASNPAGLGGTLTVNASGGVATFSNLVFSAAGSFVLTASSPATLSSLAGSTIQIAAGPQTISFGAISSQPVGTSLTLNATASSGLTVTFASLTSTVCSVSGNTAMLLKVGKCTIQATQPGNANYNAATPVNQSFTLTQASQTITFGPLSNQPYGAAPFAVSATASSGLTVKFASTTRTVCTVSGTTVTLVKVGTCTITASQPGNAEWPAAMPVTQSFQVTKGSQTITFAPLSNQAYGSTPVSVSATASSGLPVTFTSTTTAVCTASGGAVTILAVGKCSIRATQPGNADYVAATPVTQSFQVTKATQSITFGPLPNQPLGTALFPVNASATSGLAVTFASTTMTTCTIFGNTVTLKAVGLCTIRATQPGNADYSAATAVSQSFRVTP